MKMVGCVPWTIIFFHQRYNAWYCSSLLNISFSFCWRPCPKPLQFMFLNLACSLHSSTPSQKTVSFPPVFPAGLRGITCIWAICSAQGGSAADRILLYVQKFRGLTFALAPGWTHPPQSFCLQGRAAPESFFCSLQQLGSHRRSYGSHKALQSSFLPGIFRNRYSWGTHKVFHSVMWSWKDKPAVSHVLPVMKTAAWNTHWPPSSVSNLPLDLNNSPAPQAHAAPTENPLGLTQLLPGSLTAQVWAFPYNKENAAYSSTASSTWLCGFLLSGTPPQFFTGNC